MRPKFLRDIRQCPLSTISIRKGSAVLILINGPALINAPAYFSKKYVNLHEFLFGPLDDIAL